ncbi:MAG: hypothetical protein ACP5HU_05440, partial [Phycisphaerae bacterium]
MIQISAGRGGKARRCFDRGTGIAQRTIVGIVVVSLACLSGCRGRSEKPGEAVWEAVSAAYEEDAYKLSLRDQGLRVWPQTVRPAPPDDEQWQLHSTPITDVWLPKDADAPVVKESDTFGPSIEMYVDGQRIWLWGGEGAGLFHITVDGCEIQPIYEGLENAGLGPDEARKVGDAARQRLLALNGLELTEKYLSADHQKLRDATTPEKAAEIGLLLLARQYGSLPSNPAWRIERGDEVIHIFAPHHSSGHGLVITGVRGPDKATWWHGFAPLEVDATAADRHRLGETLCRVFAPTPEGGQTERAGIVDTRRNSEGLGYLRPRVMVSGARLANAQSCVDALRFAVDKQDAPSSARVITTSGKARIGGRAYDRWTASVVGLEDNEQVGSATCCRRVGVRVGKSQTARLARPYSGRKARPGAMSLRKQGHAQAFLTGMPLKRRQRHGT